LDGLPTMIIYVGLGLIYVDFLSHRLTSFNRLKIAVCDM
jgi:hypothetical protein